MKFLRALKTLRHRHMLRNAVSPPNVTTHNVMIRRGFSYTSLIDLTDTIYSASAGTFNQLVREYCENKELDKAIQVKKEMVQRGFLPDAVTYSRLIIGLCWHKQRQRLPEAFHLFREMLWWGLLPDEYTYSSLVNAYCLGGEFSKVFNLHDQMIHNGVVPDFVTELLLPSLVTYNALIYGYCFLGRVDEALGILRGMPEMGLSPDAVSYNIVISGFCRIREPGKAYELKMEMDEKRILWMEEVVYKSIMQGLSDEDAYSSLMNDYLAQGDMEKAYILDREIAHDGYLSESVTDSVFINGLNKKARTKEAKEILLSMISNSCLSKTTHTTYDALIENCSNNEFKSLVELVKGFRMRGLVSEAAIAHDTMLHGNHKPDGGVYNFLIVEHCRCKNVDKAYNMYTRMVRYGFVPHMFSVLALINALHRARRYDGMTWVIRNTLRSCNLYDSELLKVLNEIDVHTCQIEALLDVLAEIAMDGLLLNGGNCS